MSNKDKRKEKNMNKIWKNKWFIVGAIVTVLGAIFLLYNNVQAQQAAADAAAEFETEEVKMDTLVASVEASGNLRSNQSVELFWETSGTVEEVYVEIGQEVEEGEILAVLDQKSLPNNVILAAQDLYNAQQALEDIHDQYNALAISEAQKAVADAEDAVKDAERYLDNLLFGANQTDIDEAEANMVIAQDNLEEAEEKWNKHDDRKVGNVDRAYAQQAYAQAQQAYDDAARIYAWLTGSASDIDLAIAEADLAVAQENLIEAQEKFDEVLAGIPDEELAAAEAMVAAAEATLAQAQIEAPFDGTVTDVFPQPGDQVFTNTQAFYIDDLTTLYVDLLISEFDIPKIEVGQEVIVEFDAIISKQYSGVVDDISMVGEIDAGVVNYTATIALTEEVDILVGMSAEVEIVINQEEPALLVPNQAVQVLDGKQVVYVMVAGSMEPIEVTLGLSSDSYSEVLAGNLQEGDLVVLNPTAGMDEEVQLPPGPFSGNGPVEGSRFNNGGE
jgi:HlyD family secretion protein